MKATCPLLGSLLALAACHGTDPAPPQVTAAFTLPTAAEATVPAALQNTSQNATSYRWSFGDNSTSTAAAPSHTYAKEGTYSVTLRAYGANQDSAVASQSLTVGAYNVFAHTTINIAGTYDFVLTKQVSVPFGGSTTSSHGTLTVTQTGPATINVATPDFNHSSNYRVDPNYPSLYEFIHYDSLYPSLASFYPTGDSLHFEVTQHLSASSNVFYLYRGHRRP